TLNSSPLGSLTYGYDSLGMRTTLSGSFARTGLPQPAPVASYDAANQLTGWNESILSYDQNGNTLNDGSHAYTWDARNHLSAIDSGTTGSFVYDPLGRRATKVIFGSSTSFLYDFANPVQELSGSTPTANLLTGGLDEYFTRGDAAGSRNFLADALGSTIALADLTGAIQVQYSYQPFGTTDTLGTSASTYQYTGRENDGDGLYYSRARYYNYEIGRFIAQDPLGYKAGDTNLYSYTYNNPITFRDPSGKIVPLVVGAVLCGTGAALGAYTYHELAGRKSSIGGYLGSALGGCGLGIVGGTGIGMAVEGIVPGIALAGEAGTFYT